MESADDDDFDEKRLWERMLSASKFGDCLLTVATGELAVRTRTSWRSQLSTTCQLVRKSMWAGVFHAACAGNQVLATRNPVPMALSRPSVLYGSHALKDRDVTSSMTTVFVMSKGML